jgi:hypothetical protein
LQTDELKKNKNYHNSSLFTLHYSLFIFYFKKIGGGVAIIVNNDRFSIDGDAAL